MVDKVKVLIVDDSGFMRKIMSKILNDSGKIEVIGEGKNGSEAVEMAGELKPDVITLDINMPVMDGLTALEKIMKENPTPVIMVSSLTTEDAEITFEALEKGAVEFFPKQMKDFNANIKAIKDDLIPKIENIARKKRIYGFPFLGKRRRENKPLEKKEVKPQKTMVVDKTEVKEPIELVVLGSSTGGPNALNNILPKLPEDFPSGIIISQHMPAAFTGTFAERMNRLSKITVKEATTGDKVEKGTVLITPGGKHMYLKRYSVGLPEVIISEEPKNAIYKPSVSVMAKSVSETYKGQVIGVMLTGMGSDGKDGFVEIKRKNKAVIIAQNEASCVVYGMPKAVVDAGIADYILDIKDIASTLDKIVRG